MPKCIARGCKNESNKNVKVCFLPEKDSQRRKIWLDNAGLKEENLPKCQVFCEVNFFSIKFNDVGMSYLLLKTMDISLYSSILNQINSDLQQQKVIGG